MNASASVLQAKRQHLQALVRERRRLEEQSSYFLPFLSAALTLSGIGLAALGTSILEPISTFLGLCLAFAGIPFAVRSFVDARTAEETLATLMEDIGTLAEEIAELETDDR